VVSAHLRHLQRGSGRHLRRTFPLGNGQNFSTITGGNFSSVMLSTAVNTTVDVRQIRLGGDFTPTPVPERASLALFGLACSA
jgi:hypothetical protein